MTTHSRPTSVCLLPSKFLFLLLFVPLLSGCASLRNKETLAGTRPNILVILCDDLGYGDLGCYGHPSIRTPNLDRLAAEGMRLTSCYSAAPVCSPSRAGLLTGKVPSRIGVYDWIPQNHPMHLRDQELTIAELLRSGGYQTCLTGKWHLNGKFNSKEQPQPSDQGFDYWFATQNNAGPSHRNPRNFVRNGTRVGPIEGFSCQIVADEATRWLREERQPDHPFFVLVTFHEPHEPIDSPDDLVASYPGATKRGEALYYANVSNMDRAVGTLLDTLDSLNVAENTLGIVTSDKGPETVNRYTNAWRSHGSPGDLRGMKLHLYEGGIRVPGIVRWKNRILSGQIRDEAVSSVDLLPTFRDLAGLPSREDTTLAGTSLVPFLQGGEIHREQPLYWHYHRSIGAPKAAMRDGDWMILGTWDGPQLDPGASLRPGDMELIKTAKLVGFELYDLKADPRETTDCSAREPERLEQLKRQLLERYTEVQNAGPVWTVNGN